MNLTGTWQNIEILLLVDSSSMSALHSKREKNRTTHEAQRTASLRPQDDLKDRDNRPHLAGGPPKHRGDRNEVLHRLPDRPSTYPSLPAYFNTPPAHKVRNEPVREEPNPRLQNPPSLEHTIFSVAFMRHDGFPPNGHESPDIERRAAPFSAR